MIFLWYSLVCSVIRVWGNVEVVNSASRSQPHRIDSLSLKGMKFRKNVIVMAIEQLQDP